MGVVAASPAQQMSRSMRVALRVIVASAFVVIALLFFGGRAHADDATTASPPAADSTPAPAPANTDATPPPSGAQQEPTSPTPAGADGPQPTNDQNAAVTNTGTGVANTGANAAGASGTGTSGTSTSPTDANSGSGSQATPAKTDATGSATTGSANATGSNAQSGVDQKAVANTADQGRVDILQIGLVVNIGVGTANSGGNVAGASTGTGATSGSAKGSVQTGNTGAVGNAAKTGVTQSAVIGNGDVSKQKAIVLNVGIAIGNSGLNITIGRIDNTAPKSSTTLTGGRANGQVYTGNTAAVGDAAKSHITQIAGGLAKGNATLVIDQRALIVNFGVALANSGGNLAFATFDKSQLTPEEAQIVEAVLSVLAPFFAPANGSGALGSANALVKTGGAGAIGNASTTNVLQQAIGGVDGHNSASSHQIATVGNLGLAIANSGLNGAFATTGGALTPEGAQLQAAQNGLATFLSLLSDLSWLDSANPFAQFAQTVNIGGVTLDLSGSLQGGEYLLGWDNAFAPDGGPIPGGVRVRQISGVINIGIAESNTGDNLVIATVDGTRHDGKGGHVLDSNGTNSNFDALASVLTGKAVAWGNVSNVSVCQAFHDTVACAMKKTTHSQQPPADSAVLDASATNHAPAAAAADPSASASGSLPFTGTNSNAPLELAGALLGLGAALASVRRRRGERV